jgi:hypothetical protein
VPQAKRRRKRSERKQGDTPQVKRAQRSGTVTEDTVGGERQKRASDKAVGGRPPEPPLSEASAK